MVWRMEGKRITTSEALPFVCRYDTVNSNGVARVPTGADYLRLRVRSCLLLALVVWTRTGPNLGYH